MRRKRCVNGPKMNSYLVKKLAALEPTAWVSEEVPWKRSTADAAVEGQAI